MGKQVFNTDKAINNLIGNAPDIFIALAANSYMHLFEGKTKEEILQANPQFNAEDLDDEDFIYMEEN